MSESASVSVRVPATTANLGPGFDCLGAALSRYNQFYFAHLSAPAALEIEVVGAEAARVTTERDNLVYRAFCYFFEQLGQQPPGVKVQIELGVPLARGLGSSATAIVAGLLGANALAGQPMNLETVLAFAIALEGHPDNVAPALLGGCQLSASSPDGDWTLCDIPWSAEIVSIVAIPDFELSTEAARAVLPQTCDYKTAIFTSAHLALLVKALESGRGDWLQAALQDQLHQPYRETLIPGYAAVTTAARQAGAYGAVISGAGPTLLALGTATTAPDIAIAMQTAWAAVGINAEVVALKLDRQGALVERV